MISYSEFVQKIKEFEGFRLKSYKCPSGVLTIGYGHTHGVITDMTITEFDADVFLSYDLHLVRCQLSDTFPGLIMYSGLYYALVDFIFNFGFTKFKNSTLLKVLKTIDLSQPLSHNDVNRISIQLLRWNKSNGKVLRGLEARRQWEVSLLTME